MTIYMTGAEEFGISKSTLSRHRRGQQAGKIGRPCVFTRKATGIHRVNRDQVLKRLPKYLVDLNCDMQNESTAIIQSFQAFLKEARTLKHNLSKRKKEIKFSTRKKYCP
nr:unnamed protein product [Callosobruchus analis]CAI5838191.1 unnamed protein product [Callosobruchus analis]